MEEVAQPPMVEPTVVAALNQREEDAVLDEIDGDDEDNDPDYDEFAE